MSLAFEHKRLIKNMILQ